MSYDIYLVDDQNNILELSESHDLKGGTYAVGGTKQAWLNITYNYSQHFKRVLGEKGIRSIYGRTAEETIPILKEAASKLKDDVSGDYWESTEGNAKAALLDLIQLGEATPQGVWEGD